MVKMRNTSDFRQAVTIGGTRVLMLPNDVIESSKALSYVWLEEVDDDAPVTVTASRRVSSLKNTVDALRTANADAVVTSKEELDELKKSIEESSLPLAEELDNTQRDLIGLKEELESFKNTVHRRLEIMKSAMMTMQQDFYEIEFDEEGRVSQDDTKSES